MARQESETQLAGQLAASLTPRISHVPLQQRGDQNSGLFDIGAMYAASVEQVMRRAQAVRQPFVVGIAEAPPAPAAQARGEWPRVAVVDEYEEVDLGDEYMAIPGLTPRGRIGWFAVAVAWLGTAVLAAFVATMVPAHGMKGTAPTAAAAPIAPAPVQVAPTLVPAPQPATATATLTAATLTATPTPTPTATPTPTPTPRVATAPVRPRPVAHTPVAAPASAPAAVAKAAAAADPDAPVPAKAPVAAKAPVVAATAAAAPAGGGSLEDLIRQAVAAESKHH